MRRSTFALVLASSFFTVRGHTADRAPAPSVVAVSGYLFDEMSGELTKEDVFSPSYAPQNRLGASLLVVVTVDMGKGCAMPELSGPEAVAVARGQLAPPSRPALCDRPPGKVVVRLRSKGDPEQRQELTLSKFFTGESGKLRVPLLFYRRSQCVPLEIAVAASGQRAAWTKKVNFFCAE